jgi:ribosomal protein S18 acetylase RimI-like enzyme
MATTTRPTVTLQPMTPEEWEVWGVGSIAAFAADMVRLGGWPAAEAEARATAQFKQILPAGRETPGHQFRSIVAEGGKMVGHLWFGPHQGGGPSDAFIWDIAIVAESRGHGYGRAALEALEPIVRGLGYESIGLHVFGDNEVARHLYRSVGYVETEVSMQKRLA